MIYFMQSKETGLIKIGTTKNLRDRRRSLEHKTKQTFALLGIADGSFKEEKLIHLRFANLRSDGSEMFRAGDDLLEFIASLPPIPTRLAEDFSATCWAERKTPRKHKGGRSPVSFKLPESLIEAVAVEARKRRCWPNRVVESLIVENLIQKKTQEPIAQSA